VKGEIPNPISPPSGCTFHPRCPLVFERCRIENPPVIDGVACHAVNANRAAA
jgi:peptide/nickel transport system ATP-binding protein